jgi:hypothetical protein
LLTGKEAVRSEISIHSSEPRVDTGLFGESHHLETGKEE